MATMETGEATAEPGYYHHGYSHYGGYGHGYYGKREADAEPGYYHHGYGHHGYGGYGHGYYGNRERGKLMLSQDTIIMATDIMDMVDMVMATMERGKPKQLPLLSQDTITMDTAIMEVMDTVIMERERLMLSPVIIIMAMDMVMVMATVMDTMVKQQLFIDSSIFSIIDLDFLKSSQQ